MARFYGVGTLSAIVLLISGCVGFDKTQTNSPQSELQSITGENALSERERWDKKFEAPGYVYGRDPSPFLSKHISQLQPSGAKRALLMPLEEGRNAVFLAQKGFRMTAVDFSEQAILKAKRLAREKGVSVRYLNADLTQYQIPKNQFDVILVIDFFRPRLIQQIRNALKPGGKVYFETLTTRHLQFDPGIRRDYLLKPGQLRQYFSDYEIHVYEEAALDQKAFAAIVATKP